MQSYDGAVVQGKHSRANYTLESNVSETRPRYIGALSRVDNRCKLCGKVFPLAKCSKDDSHYKLFCDFCWENTKNQCKAILGNQGQGDKPAAKKVCLGTKGNTYNGQSLDGPSQRDSRVVPGQRASLSLGRQATLESNLASHECTPEEQATPDGTAGLGCTLLTTAARSAPADEFPAAADGFPARECAQAAEAVTSWRQPASLLACRRISCSLLVPLKWRGPDHKGLVVS